MREGDEDVDDDVVDDDSDAAAWALLRVGSVARVHSQHITDQPARIRAEQLFPSSPRGAPPTPPLDHNSPNKFLVMLCRVVVYTSTATAMF